MEIDIFKVSTLENNKGLGNNGIKNSACSGTSISDGFGDGFRMVLGVQNHLFSNFIRCFF